MRNANAASANGVRGSWFTYGVIDGSNRITQQVYGWSSDQDRTATRIGRVHLGKTIVGPFFGQTQKDADIKYAAALQSRGMQ